MNQILFDNDLINSRLKVISNSINGYYNSVALLHPLQILVLANGGLTYAVDLTRLLYIPFTLDTVIIKSYNEKSQGEIDLKYFPNIDLSNRHILILDDIYDTGTTIQFMKNYIEQKHTNFCSINVSTMVWNLNNCDGNPRHQPDWYCFSTNGEWIWGRGLDNDGVDRNLLDIWYKKE